MTLLQIYSWEHPKQHGLSEIRKKSLKLYDKKGGKEVVNKTYFHTPKSIL